MKIEKTTAKRLQWVCIAAFLALALTSCSARQARISPPKIAPDKAGASAVEMYDTDGDKLLSPEEMQKCPGLKETVASYDIDGDGHVSADEIAARLRKWQEKRMAMRTVSCRVEWGGRPLSGATVSFVPEPFLGEAIASASGVTDENGMAAVGVAPEDLPEDLAGLTVTQPGIFKVEITHPIHKVPAKYNSATELGVEVAQDNPKLVNLVFRMESR